MHESKKKNVTLIALLFNLWLKAKVGYTTLGLLRCIKVKWILPYVRILTLKL